VAILAEDVTFAMPPHPHWWRGRDDVIVRSGARSGRRRACAPGATGRGEWRVYCSPGAGVFSKCAATFAPRGTSKARHAA
jgi:hypothetical protein